MTTQGTGAGLAHTVEQARKEAYYQNYLLVRECVWAMLDEEYAGLDNPSLYWEEELAGFDYLLDASPLIIRKIREHSYHITGLKSYEYRQHHSHKAKMFLKKLNSLRAIDTSDLLIPESPELGGFGHIIDGELINIDTLKFYESLIALDRGGELERLRSMSSRPVVVEIGGGWGGFAYQFKETVPESTYVIVDLPQTLLFSGVYLKTLFPDAKFFIYGEDGNSTPPGELNEYDFVLMPHFSIKSFKPQNISLGINMISFQEMTSDQVSGYASWLWDCGCSTIYSHNRGRSAHNTQLSDVPILLGQGYDLQTIEVLPIPYTVLATEPTRQWGSKPKLFAKHVFKKILYPTKPSSSHLDYKHMVGLRRDAFNGVENV